jgi:hypothetical protein
MGNGPDDNLLSTSHPPTLGRSHRRIYNLLIANAWDRIGDDVTHCVAKADLRGSHEGGERLADSIDRLAWFKDRLQLEPR